MKMPKNAQRAYAIASYIGASLKAYGEATPELAKVHLQCKRAMQIYSVKAGYKETMELADILGDVWREMGEKYSATIEEDSVPALVEAFGFILSPKDYKDFLGISQYIDIENQKNKYYNDIMRSVNMLNHRLNEVLGTKSVVLQKPKEVKKKEKKVREKSKKQKEHEKKVAEIAESKKRVKSFLQERIAMNKRKNNAD